MLLNFFWKVLIVFWLRHLNTFFGSEDVDFYNLISIALFLGGGGGGVKILPQFSISYPLRLTTSVVFVPSHRDVHHHFVYPQPPFESRISKAEGGVSEVWMICFPKITLCFRCSFSMLFMFLLVITSKWIRTVCDFVSSYCQNIKIICKPNKPVYSC